MKRLLFIVVIALLVGAIARAKAADLDAKSPQQNLPVVLKENLLVAEDYIRLGDLFSNIDQSKAEIAVAYSPKPGRKATFDARWLYRVARNYGLPWRPLTRETRTIVERESVTVGRPEIEDAIMAALASHDIPENVEIELSNRQARLFAEADQLPQVQIDDIAYDSYSKRFTALIYAASEPNHNSPRTRISGRLYEVIDLPVLTHRLGKGDIIRKEDIAWKKTRSENLQRDTIFDVEDLIGKSPKRYLREERAIRATEVRDPVLVERGAVVTIVLKTGTMTLTSQGRALEDGANGKTVRITNTRSNKTIDAVVIGSNLVTVVPAGQLAMASWTQE